jgi:hypothetical protein
MTQAGRCALAIGVYALTQGSGQAAPSSALSEESLGALRKEACAAPQVQPVSESAFFIRCTTTQDSPKDGPVTRTRLYAAQQGPKSGAVYKLIEYSESRALRTKVGTRYQILRKGTRVTYRAEQGYGHLRSLTWELGASPPQLVEEVDGGNRACRQAIEVSGANYVTPDLVMPRCETDYLKARQSCVKQVLVCGTDELKAQSVRILNIPLRQAGGATDPLACALRVGPAKQDVLSGKNGRGTSFQIAAEDDPVAGRLRLFLQAQDATPKVAPGRTKDPLPFDHFELWLGSKREEPRCVEPGGEDAFCQERTQAQTFRVTLVPAEGGQSLILPEASDASAEHRKQLQAEWKAGRLTVILEGELRAWALSGVLAVRYSDSESGTRRDSLLGTTPGDAAHPETWSQLARPTLCSPPAIVRVGNQ